MDQDFLLIQKMKHRDEAAMESFVRKYYPVILRYCCCHVPDRGYAEDLTQETFEKFFGALGTYKHRGKAENYLYVIAGNLCRNFYKKKTEISVSEPPEKAENAIHILEDRLDVEAAVRCLPQEMREVVILYYFQGLKLKEIAEILDISLHLVKYRIRRAKEQLGMYLGKEEEL